MEITVGHDGSSTSAEAVRWAADEAAARGARLRIVSCYQIPVADAMPGWTATGAIAGLLEATERIADEARDLVMQRHPTLPLRAVVSAGPASVALVEDVAADDLLVLGASSHHGAGAFWLGSTPRSVIRHAPCPVVVVRGAVSRGRPDRIVVGVDGSPAAAGALRWAANEADLHGVELLVVHGWWYPYLPSESDSSARARDLTEVDAACVLDRSIEEARALCGVTVHGSLLEAGPVTALLDTVRDGDLMVVGSAGRGAIMSGLFGSTVNGVLERSVVPVVVVPGGKR